MDPLTNLQTNSQPQTINPTSTTPPTNSLLENDLTQIEQEEHNTPHFLEQQVEKAEGKAVMIDSSNFAPSDDELSGDEDVEMFGEGVNEYSDDEYEDEHPAKKKIQLSSLIHESSSATAAGVDGECEGGVSINTAKKIKKKYNCVWTKPAARKGKKKAKPASVKLPGPQEDVALVTPMPKVLDKCDDSPDMSICLSRVYKAEKVDLSEDRMSAGSVKGYRMVRATRGVVEGAWYFEIKVVHLGESGHTRLGWSTEKGDLQAPVGYDAFSYGYRDIDGDKYHKGVRGKYGVEGYKEGDVIGFYINLPNGEMYAPKQSHVVMYKGQKYLCAPDEKNVTSEVVPGSCISFFKNGISQGIAYEDVTGGRYYPAASMYTLPNQQNCEVKFNFGPVFDCYPTDFGDCPVPKPMIEVPYHGYDSRIEPVAESVKVNDAGNDA